MPDPLHELQELPEELHEAATHANRWLDHLYGLIVAPVELGPFTQFEGATLDGAGAGTARFNGPKAGHYWLVERATIVATGGPSASLYVGAVHDLNLASYAPQVTRATLDEASPIFVPELTPLTVTYAGGTPSGSALARVQGRLFYIPELDSAGMP